MQININGRGRVRRIARLLGVLGLAAPALVVPLAGGTVAAAQPCPDVEVVFARGTSEPPGVGGTGQAFADSLRARLGERSVNVYAVDYPASTDFPTAAQGVIDASSHIGATAAHCPATKMVLGGYSQGAAVIGYVTTDAMPVGYTPPPGITEPMPPGVADNVAAVVLFGKPSGVFLDLIGAPPIVIGSRYVPKTIDLCNAGDPICNPDGDDNMAHVMYGIDGLVNRAADFAAQRISQPPG
jgi:cutinase